MKSSSSSDSSYSDSSDAEQLDPSYFANAKLDIKNEQNSNSSIKNIKEPKKSISSSSSSNLSNGNNKASNKEHNNARQQQIPQVNLDAAGMSESDKDIDKAQKQSYVLKLSMLPSQPIPARKFESANDDPIFAKNNKDFSIEIKENKKNKQESEFVNIKEDERNGKEDKKSWNIKKKEDESKKDKKVIKVEEIKIFTESFEEPAVSENNQKRKENVKAVINKGKEPQEESKANNKSTEPLPSSEIVNKLKIQPKIPKKNSPKERDSVSSIDSRPSVRGKKEKFMFDFPNDQEISNPSNPKSSENPPTNQNKKANLSQKYKNLDSSDSSLSSSSSNEEEIKAPIKKPQQPQENLQAKSNSPLFKLNAEKKKENKTVEVPIKNELEPEIIDKKIPELPQAVQVARKLKNNPSDLQNEEVKPIEDPPIEPPVEKFHKEIGLNIPKIRSKEIINADIDEVKNYTFEEALCIFKTLNIPKSSSRVMIRPSAFVRLFCGCCGTSNVNLTKDQAEDCDKIISFSETAFKMSQAFHKSLLLSVYCSITNEDSWPHSFKKIGISNFDKETKGKGIPQYLIFILFFTNFFTKSTREMFDVSKDKEKGFPLLPCLLKLGDIAIKVLKENKLNKFIKSNKKTFEVIFLFYAGIVLYWYKNFIKSNSNMAQFDSIYSNMQRKAMGGPNDLILLARSTLANQSKEKNI